MPLILILLLFSVVENFAQSPHGKDLKIDCSFCHESTSWKVIPDSMKFDHEVTGFALTGQHSKVECRACHQSLIFSEAKKTQDCFSCHKDIHRGSVGFDCQRCHTTETWIVKDINVVHRQSRFPLVGAHRLADCVQCHKDYQDLNFQVIAVDCYSCHQANYAATTAPNHITAGFSTKCEECHDVTSMVWSATNFNHDVFPLVGGHNIACADCHGQGNNFQGLSTACYSCHAQNFANATDPNHVAGNFPHECQVCHTIYGWSPASFNHDNTPFPLTGAHKTVQCASCHTQGYTGTPTDCYSCHQSSYAGTTNPNHQTIGISTDCATCHTTNPGWQPATFPIHNNFFELLGAHATIANNCAQCHNGNYNNTPNQCYGCHANDYNGTTNPNHQAAGFGTDCQTCHSQTAWQPATFNHDGQWFPIYSGRHNGTWQSCSDCHTNPNNFSVFSCITCHEHNQQDTDSQHQGVQGYVYESSACYACHPTGDAGGAFNHDLSGFPLTGAHLVVDCVQCHVNGYNTPPPTACNGCHQTNYNGTTNPNHQMLGLSTNCETCHTTNPGWQPAQFPQHNQYFALLGQHAAITDCNSCHNGNYNMTSVACLQCHQNDYNGATNPNHVAAGIPTACEDCHTASGWTPSIFNHSTTGFVLDGAHTTLPCSSCHQGTIQGLNSNCVSCHQNDYNNAQNPNHVAAGIPTTCQDCHTTTAWTPSTFNHSTTGFVLDGAHATLQCSACHQGTIQGLNPDCVSCHQTDYNNAQNPNHVAAGIPTTCTQCHTTTAWIPSTFDHSTTGFPLLGVHAQIQCSACHQGIITGLSPACLPCHQSDYNSAPDHVALNYPTNCDMCHSFEGWVPSTFNHDNTNFPLTGAHLQVPCSSCHSSGFQGTPTACYACHETAYNNTTNPSHTALQLPTTCETCHTTNPGWQPATFPIHANYFPFVGAHIPIQNDCDACHHGDYNNTPNTCYGCHSADYDATTDPPHQQLNFSHDCTTCHTQNAWQPANFDHSFYVLYGNHSTMNCNNCHSLANYQPQCLSCHNSDFLEGHNPGDPTDCWNCHSTQHFGDAKPFNNLKLN